MTAITQYSSLEGMGRWRNATHIPLQSVVAVLGKRTLTLRDVVSNDIVLAHWDLHAVTRIKTDPQLGVCFGLGPHRPDEFWLSADQTDFITALDAIEEALKPPPVKRKRPWGRYFGFALSVSILAFVGYNASNWKNAFITHSLSGPMRQSVTRALLETLEAQNILCTVPQNDPLFADLNAALDHTSQAYIASTSLVHGSFILSKGAVLLDQTAFYDDPETDDIHVRLPILEDDQDPLATSMHQMGLWPTLRFLLSGAVPSRSAQQIVSELQNTDTSQTPQIDKTISGALLERLNSRCFHEGAQ